MQTGAPLTPRPEKRPFDFDEGFARIAAAVEPYPPAAMWELAQDGYTSLFEQLVSCIISIRTYDEVTVVAARRLLERARAPADLAALSPGEIDTLISPSTFHERKAFQIREIARRTVEELGGTLPCDLETLLSFSGVGVKCAHLALGIACGLPLISVDVHVHRVTNRWGIVATSGPEKTVLALEVVLPDKYWVEINRLLVPFGKHICTGQLPRCSTCPVEGMCMQVGVNKHR